jgi:hypothetical protein
MRNTAIRAEIGARLRAPLSKEQPPPRVQHLLDCLSALDDQAASVENNVHFHTKGLERIPDSRVIVALAGKATVAGRDYYARQAATLLKYARSTSDPKIAAALLEMAVELSSQLDETAPPDSSPRAPDVERPA